MVIVGAAFLYYEGDAMGASIKIVLIIDAVVTLFFVQSRRAQEAMGAFFEKLRTDRQFIEARKICDEIKDDAKKDNIKTILVLHYSGLQSTGMLDVLAGVPPQHHIPTFEATSARRRSMKTSDSARDSKATALPSASITDVVHKSPNT